MLRAQAIAVVVCDAPRRRSRRTVVKVPSQRPSSGGADVDGVHRGPERHVSRIEARRYWKNARTIRRRTESAAGRRSVWRQHVGRQPFLDDRHRGDGPAGRRTNQAQTGNERGRKACARLATLSVNETAPASQNRPVPAPAQCKTRRDVGLPMRQRLRGCDRLPALRARNRAAQVWTDAVQGEHDS